MHTTNLRFSRLATLALLAAAALAGCGGGETAVTTPTPPVTPSALTLTGTAATGRAWGGATLTAKCASGTGSATTNADGSYTVSVSGGALPCVVRVVGADGKALHSVAEGSGSSAIVNISPLTELIVIQAAGGSAADMFSSFDATAQAKVTSAALASATAAVATALQSVVNLSGINPIKDVLVAANGNVAGNALDQKLDVLVAALAAAKLTVAELGNAIVNNGTAAAVVVASQVKPAAAGCASARSGHYRVFDPLYGTAVSRNKVEQLTLDGPTMTMSYSIGRSTYSASAVAGKPCQFTYADGAHTKSHMFSASGVYFERQETGGGSFMRIGMPEQTVALADLAGIWNTVEYENVGEVYPASFRNSYATVTVNAAGRITAGLDCKQLLPCTAWATLPTGFVVNTVNGGFDVTEADGRVTRLFAYRAPSGDMMMLGMMPNGGVIVASKQVPFTMPTVGETTSFWESTIGSAGSGGAMFEDTRVVTSVDSSAGTYSRRLNSLGRVDTLAVDAPRTGLLSRKATACATEAGVPVSACSGVLIMVLRGMGVTAIGSAVEGTNFFAINVTKPAGSGANVARLGTLVWTGGQTYPMRANITLNAAGQVNGGSYDFHKLDGTSTACTHSDANDATCHGASADFSATSQSAAIGAAGASGVSLIAGPDAYGFTFSGTLNGSTWSGSWTKVATGNSSDNGSGSFSVALVISVKN